MRSRAGRIVLVAVFSLLPLAAAAQEITGTITGTVLDQTGAVMPGVTVHVKNVDTGQAKDFVTTDTGRYTAPLLPVGRYEVTFQISGFQTFTARNIPLHVNDRLEMNATLKPGGVAETVEVTAAATLIQPTAAVQTLVSPVQVAELPINNRNFMLLTTLAPGVSSDLPDEVGVGLDSVTSISVNGARRNGVSWLVDGASNVDVGSNITLLSTPSLESIEEFKMLTSSYAAEWPRSGGGVVNVITKSGTNQFRASAYEFFRNDKLNANSFFRKLSTDPTIRDHPARLRYNNFGYTLGGPIQKDKLFFFFSQEWRRIARAPASTIANVPDPAWLTDPSNPNYVAPGDRDANAVRLLAGWPAPNVAGVNQYVDQAPAVTNTRQEVVRLDYAVSGKWRLMGRYSHDLTDSTQTGGLFVSTPVPNIANTRTEIPGQVFVAQLTGTLNPNTLNEFSYQLSGNKIATTNPDGTRNKRSDYSVNIAELFPENLGNIIPTINVTGLSALQSGQLYNIVYWDHTVSDNLSLQRGNHAIKIGGLVSFESKDENAANSSQGSFTFAAGGGFTAFQNFLRGNTGGLCGTNCSYTEAERDVTEHLRFGRYEFYAQDSWKARHNLTVDFGLRYSIYTPVVDKNNLLTNFDPARYDRSRAPQFANAAGTLLLAGTGDLLNGIVVASQNSPHGRKIYGTDKNNFGPRLGLSWDPKDDNDTLIRAGFGIYYDQPLIGIFEQNSFTNPPFVNNPQILNPALTNPAAGVAATTRGVQTLIASSDPFDTPRTIQWNLGMQRKLYSKGVVEVGYVGSRGDSLIRPININIAQPADVVRLGGENVARPFAGYGTITMRATTARARYNGLLFNFRHEGGRSGLLNVAYTLSRNRTDASNDRDATDLPQNPQDLEAEYNLARTDRTHIFNASYVYELPFFRNDKGLAKAVLGGWQIAGITTFQSGAPIPRLIISNTNSGRRGTRVVQLSDPFANLPSDRYFFNPAAFAPAADGSFGQRERYVFRMPGRNQWDFTLSKNWYPSQETRLQFRADFINAFNHTQFTFTPTDAAFTCTAGPTDPTCAVANSPFGTYRATRLPREIQLGLKLYWK